MAQVGIFKSNDIDENFLRHMILNSIRSIKTKYSYEYGKLIFLCDSKGTTYWRKTLFPYYKANRKKTQDASPLDWTTIYTSLNRIKQELRDHFPYTVIEVETAEADDAIAALINTFGTDMNYGEKILLLSHDKDFNQLHRYGNLRQYDAIRKREVKTTNPDEYLHLHIMKGDSGDGIPNFLSNDNCFVIGQRQNTLTSKKLDMWLKMKPEEFCDERMLRNYNRNKLLIDLSQVPQEITDKVLISYEEQKNKKANNLMGYFVEKKLKLLMDNINDFN